jgi:hypothetical protein
MQVQHAQGQQGSGGGADEQAMRATWTKPASARTQRAPNDLNYGGY